MVTEEGGRGNAFMVKRTRDSAATDPAALLHCLAGFLVIFTDPCGYRPAGFEVPHISIYLLFPLEIFLVVQCCW